MMRLNKADHSPDGAEPRLPLIKVAFDQEAADEMKELRIQWQYFREHLSSQNSSDICI